MTNSPRTVKTAVVLTLALAAGVPSAASARPGDDQVVRTPAPIHHVTAPKPRTGPSMSAAMSAHRAGGPFVRTVITPRHGRGPLRATAQAPGAGFDWTPDGLLAGGALLASALGGLWLRQRRPSPRGTASLAS